MLFGRGATRKMGQILMPMYAVAVAYYFYVAWRVVSAGDNHIFYFFYLYIHKKKKRSQTKSQIAINKYYYPQVYAFGRRILLHFQSSTEL